MPPTTPLHDVWRSAHNLTHEEEWKIYSYMSLSSYTTQSANLEQKIATFNE
jgi:hypothetical protein